MPALGAVVAYRLTADDIRRVDAQRDVTAGFIGDRHLPGTQLPMIVVAVDGPHLSGQVFLWGNDSLAVTGAEPGRNDGQWEEIR